MCLDPHIERVIRELDHLNDMTVRGLTGDHHAMGCKIIAVMVVDLKAVSVTLIDQFCSIKGICLGLFVENTRIGTKT